MKFVKNKHLVILDVETTGIKAGVDKVIELYMLKIFNEEVVDEYYSKFNPQIEIPLFISNLTGIYPWHVENSPKIKNEIEKIKNFVEDSVNETLELITLPDAWFTRCVSGTDINYGKSMFKWNVQLTRKYRELTGNEYVCLGEEFHPDIKFVHFTHRMNKPHEWEHYADNI